MAGSDNTDEMATLRSPHLADCMHAALRDGRLLDLQVLMQLGVDPEMPDALGNAPIALAVAAQRPAFVEVLVRGGADPSWPGLLAVAIANRDLPTLCVLLEGGANPNAVDGTGRTPLMLAARLGEPDYAKALLKAGAKVDVRDSDGKLALDWAWTEGREAIAELLIAAEVPP